ncbi:ABC transporter substrate-binding protein [Micromonospora sp. DT46]|uniref:ABC transporter substrate-binding protein n=1 Tax=unclassified Micromonospora TaxID=2617518 RepID=UPI00124B095F|nr:MULTISPECIES: ABC transporter substrate-binding protein [unclassified Micromonospora]KAB1138824.1 ABC transporter substrate-binding protein [Micromonospora sp. AMSO12t]WSG02512.1 ABC transporter substrate-binding protein [Micromonospora sp. NBC_01740]
MRRLPMRRWVSLATLAVVGVATLGTAAACGDDSEGAGGGSGPTTLRLGYFPNITHAPAVVGVEKGIFAEKLGGDVKLETKTFNAGPAAIEAIFSGALDATYIGPNPTVNAFSKSKGEAVRVISGAASGGVALVVKPEITSVEQLRGKKISTPQLGNTQDVAIRYWLKEKGLTTTKEGGGDVKIVPQENAQTVETFNSGAIDGAWVPEPFVSRLVNAGGKVLVDERDLWPDRKFVITNLIVSTKFLKEHPDVVKKLVEGQVAANEFVNTKPDETHQAISDHIGKISGKPLDLKLIKQAWPTLEFTNDPIATSLKTGLDHAVAVGLTQPVSLDGLYDLTHLNEVLKGQGKPEVVQP